MVELVLVSSPRSSLPLSGGLTPASASLDRVDWSREVAVVVDLGEKRTGGYAVEVVRVAVKPPDQVELEVNVREPGPGMFVPQVITHPYAVARVPRANLGSGPVTLVARSGSRELARRVVHL